MAAADLRSESRAERRLSEQVRQAALDEIEARELSDEELATTLGFSQTALYSIRLTESWPLALSVHVAEALGLWVEVKIENGGNGAPRQARAA